MRSVLIVEDHDSTRQILARLLRQSGWTVLLASTIAEGMAQLSGLQSPARIVLDLDLPDGRGEGILRHVVEHRPEVRVVVVSACGDYARLAAVRALAPGAVLQKPFSLDELEKLLA